MHGNNIPKINRFKSFPPAESHIPIIPYIKSFIRSDFQNVFSYVTSTDFYFGNKARDLLYSLFKHLKEQSLLTSDSEVLIPGYTCPSLPSAIVANDLNISLYDIEPVTLKPDIASIQKAINHNTRIIIIQYLFGIPFDIEELINICKNNDIILIEDVAQSLGASIDGRYVGTQGDFSLYSFGRGKPLPALHGGLLVNNSDINIKLYQNPNRNIFSPFLKPPLVNILSNPYIYNLVEYLNIFRLGQDEIEDIDNKKITRYSKNLLINLLLYLTVYNDHRNHIANIYNYYFVNIQKLHVDNTSYPTYNRYPLYLNKLLSLNNTLFQLGIRKMYKYVIDEYPQIQSHLRITVSLSGCYKLKQSLITLPTHFKINKNIANNIISLLQSHLS